MGNGGYNGGSTILILKPSELDLNDNYDPVETQVFKCSKCGKKFHRILYFEYLEKEHHLKGCIICGYPYEWKNKSSHTCQKCGQFIKIRFGKTSRRKKVKKKKVEKRPDVISKPMVKKDDAFGVLIGQLLEEAMKEKKKS